MNCRIRFDKLLVAQTKVEYLMLVTRDSRMRTYNILSLMLKQHFCLNNWLLPRILSSCKLKTQVRATYRTDEWRIRYEELL